MHYHGIGASGNANLLIFFEKTAMFGLKVNVLQQA